MPERRRKAQASGMFIRSEVLSEARGRCLRNEIFARQFCNRTLKSPFLDGYRLKPINEDRSDRGKYFFLCWEVGLLASLESM